MHVRHIPQSLEGYVPGKDMMSGTEVYGKHGDHANAWAIKFDHIPYTKIKVESVDKVYSFKYSPEDIILKTHAEMFLRDTEKIKVRGGARVYIYHKEKKDGNI